MAADAHPQPRGALGDDEAREVAAHLAIGCAVCAAEVASFGAVAGDLALAAAPVVPRSELRARVLAAARRTAPATGDTGSPLLQFLAASEGSWRAVEPGILRKELARDGTAYLVRMAPGAEVRRHRHGVVEHCYLVAGDLRVAGRVLGAGDYHRADVGSTHAGLRSEAGCLLLIVEAPAA